MEPGGQRYDKGVKKRIFWRTPISSSFGIDLQRILSRYSAFFCHHHSVEDGCFRCCESGPRLSDSSYETELQRHVPMQTSRKYRKSNENAPRLFKMLPRCSVFKLLSFTWLALVQVGAELHKDPVVAII